MIPKYLTSQIDSNNFDEMSRTVFTVNDIVSNSATDTSDYDSLDEREQNTEKQDWYPVGQLISMEEIREGFIKILKNESDKTISSTDESMSISSETIRKQINEQIGKIRKFSYFSHDSDEEPYPAPQNDWSEQPNINDTTRQVSPITKTDILTLDTERNSSTGFINPIMNEKNETVIQISPSSVVSERMDRYTDLCDMTEEEPYVMVAVLNTASYLNRSISKLCNVFVNDVLYGFYDLTIGRCIGHHSKDLDDDIDNSDTVPPV